MFAPSKSVNESSICKVVLTECLNVSVNNLFPAAVYKLDLEFVQKYSCKLFGADWLTPVYLGLFAVIHSTGYQRDCAPFCCATETRTTRSHRRVQRANHHRQTSLTGLSITSLLKHISLLVSFFTSLYTLSLFRVLNASKSLRTQIIALGQWALRIIVASIAHNSA